MASKLDGYFSVTEEWGYIDRDSKDHRTLDIFAHKRLHEDNDAPIQPNLVLLIECKRSSHPYVFFENVIERSMPGFPFVSGLPRNRVSERPIRIFPTLTFCVSVLDAPMVLIESPKSASTPILIPWTRITKLEANPDPRSLLRYRFYAIDAVHIDHFNEVLHDHILPFAVKFSERTVRLGNVLLNGGLASDLNNWGWDQIQEKPTN